MKITIIEDTVILAENIAKKLNKEGFLTTIYTSKNSFLNHLSDSSDLYIVDLNLGESQNDGFEIIEKIRKTLKSNKPIIITSSYQSIDKKVYGFDLGADDYLPKPYLLDELLARIRSILRRESCQKTNIAKYRNLEFDIKNKVFLGEKFKNIRFTKRELIIIELFILNKNKIINRNNLIISVWGDYDGSGVSDNSINVTFFNLRKKLSGIFNLETIIGEGYILKE